MQIQCPNCGGSIAADDVNLQTQQAYCRHCNQSFDSSKLVMEETDPDVEAVPTSQAAGEIACPRRIHVEEIGMEWTARWRWLSPAIIPLLLFCITWDTFLFFWYSAAIRKHEPWSAILFPIGHVAIGVAFTYFVIASLFNSTRLRVTRSEVSVRSGPFPWFGNRTWQGLNIREVLPGAWWRKNVSSTPGLFAVRGDGRKVRLAGPLRDERETEFLRQQLVRRLNLQPVPQETAPHDSATQGWGGSKMANSFSSAPPLWFGAIFASAGLLFISIGASLLAVQRYRLAT